jgi:hypothetical protein
VHEADNRTVIVIRHSTQDDTAMFKVVLTTRDAVVE